MWGWVVRRDKDGLEAVDGDDEAADTGGRGGRACDSGCGGVEGGSEGLIYGELVLIHTDDTHDTFL